MTDSEQLDLENYRLEYENRGLRIELYKKDKEIELLKKRNGKKIIKIDDIEVKIMDLEKENDELQKQVDELKKRLHWIWAIGVDYDGCDRAESLKELIDEMVKLTQIESKDLDEYFTYNTTQGGKMNILSIVRKQAVKDTAKKYHDAVKKLFDNADCCGWIEDSETKYWYEDNDKIAKEQFGVEVE